MRMELMNISRSALRRSAMRCERARLTSSLFGILERKTGAALVSSHSFVLGSLAHAPF